MADEALIKINGVALPTPSYIKVDIQDLDGESVRPVATGILEETEYVLNMLKVTLTWNLKHFCRCDEYIKCSYTCTVYN